MQFFSRTYLLKFCSLILHIFAIKEPVFQGVAISQVLVPGSFCAAPEVGLHAAPEVDFRAFFFRQITCVNLPPQVWQPHPPHLCR